MSECLQTGRLYHCLYKEWHLHVFIEFYRYYCVHSEPCALQFIYSSWLSIHGKIVYICIRIQHVGVVCTLMLHISTTLRAFPFQHPVLSVLCQNVHWCWMNKHHTIPYHTIPYHTIPYHTIPYHTIPYHTIPYHTIHYFFIFMLFGK